MPDEIDIANDSAARDLEAAIAAARSGPKFSIRPDICLNDCGEPPIPGGLYCSDDCRIDHHARKELRRRQGLR
ncbi:hypothetical protein F1_00024 [Ralstonia phage Heva]|uniref:DUF2116 family Zn-ribbon domain-containing protein n=5 Tax=Cimandefvirus TaxID=2843366 RepID=A0A7G5BAR4_9CAUD|nr:DksA-like zinc-finger protein [Ralstonia phage Cimandef]YP_010078328.1 DksA-like zinc-finger protein [Ralstonia phage Eline]YP_010078387.1 DksA-like zinc-finger protein [Ralstonia phage Gamede]YP_010078441.1 DksA-like zinc-finger protein [Ralstonia phage Gerry]YP_010078494.1 DksA-like zinc-finger protein [Ralstonia phage Heva]QMV32652.1 hypothetical protein B2_00018 [Ralstonia phage Cimandef]QMV33067.1 hypothetical protein 3Fb_00065 [Ralstonia phage Eline]QMV33208.1 hypothetical protein 2